MALVIEVLVSELNRAAKESAACGPDHDVKATVLKGRGAL